MSTAMQELETICPYPGLRPFYRGGITLFQRPGESDHQDYTLAGGKKIPDGYGCLG